MPGGPRPALTSIFAGIADDSPATSLMSVVTYGPGKLVKSQGKPVGSRK